MAKCRPFFALILVFAWMAAPALACLPNPTMTQAEMACCKKMAGDCQMGVGRHPCCKTTLQKAAPVAALDRSTNQIRPYVVATLLKGVFLAEPTLDSASSIEPRGLPPPAPPGLNPVLRI
jgi:hypothetical protein